MPISVFSFFSGAGLLDLGFENQGYNIVSVNEFNRKFLDSYIYSRQMMNMNAPQYGYICDDVNNILNTELFTMLMGQIQEQRDEQNTVGFIGGPPCPDFSVGGKNRGREGDNGRLAQSYVDLIIACRPDFFVFENVKGLVNTAKHRIYFEELMQLLRNAGYCISHNVINALCYGVPQDRERVFLIGFLNNLNLVNGHDNNQFDFPWLQYAAFNDINLLRHMDWPKPQTFRLNSRRLFRYNVPMQLTIQYWFDQNNVLHHPNSNDRFKVKAGREKMLHIEEGDTSRKSFKRLHRWKYSPTAAYGNNEVHLHPYKVRRISVAEAMAIQSLPEEFELPRNITLSAKFKMVGNGVPYLMSEAIAHSIRDILEFGIN